MSRQFFATTFALKSSMFDNRATLMSDRNVGGWLEPASWLLPACHFQLVMRYSQIRTVNDRPRFGRSLVTNPSQDRYIVLQHLRDHCRTASATAVEKQRFHHCRISNYTVQDSRDQNWLLLSWCRRYQRWTQQQLFTDSAFNLRMVASAPRVDMENVMLSAALRILIAWEV